ncbi:hypothetical protein OE88DRAFT_792725 [Heliocybe sulcata]|uniref:Uncharacterized protein n=1 Tax=Heliocybe sulcata TaxID=5364 RepID=A0A5C3MR01_9AGAM|nr:hypothetical protein OE88DRAFT_792725 [Heliocybe sulcata]
MGHAITAALETIPLLSVGFSLTLLLPSFFVKLPLPALDSLPPLSRMRIIAAGAFHNLVTYIVLFVFISSGVGKTGWRLLGYEDVSAYGRVVTGLDEDSPLRAYIPVGSLLTALDDTALTSNSTSTTDSDRWTAYLTDSTLASPSSPGLGWCIPQAEYLNAPTACCLQSHPPSSESEDPLACFSSRCLAPLSVMNRGRTRCTPSPTNADSILDCRPEEVCAALDDREEGSLLRIAFVAQPRTGGGKTGIVVWRGPRKEVYEQVQVGTLLPPRFLPLLLPSLAGLFIQYMATIALSLYFFNMLPFPYLDGVQLLDALLDYLAALTGGPLSDRNLELEAMEGGVRVTGRSWTSSRSPRKEQVARGVRVYTIVISSAYIALGVVEWVVQR